MQYTLLFDWMFDLTKDPLTLTEAVTYAVIYSFSRDNRGAFTASYKYISKLTRLSERQQIRVLTKLIKEDLIRKIETEFGMPNQYVCNLDKIPSYIKEGLTNFNNGGYDKMSHPMTSNSLLNKNNINKVGYDKMSHPMTSATSTSDKTYDKMSEYINNINKYKYKKQLEKSNCSRYITREDMDEEAESSIPLNLLWLKK